MFGAATHLHVPDKASAKWCVALQNISAVSFESPVYFSYDFLVDNIDIAQFFLHFLSHIRDAKETNP